MVAASKLRRAQNAAEAARPYANKMDAVISNIAAAANGSPGAPALLAGTGKDQVHLLLVCTGERGLSGAFIPVSEDEGMIAAASSGARSSSRAVSVRVRPYSGCSQMASNSLEPSAS